MSQNKKTLCAFAEDTVYSFKGHLKTADWMRISKRLYLIFPILGSMILLILDIKEIYESLLLIMILLFSFLAFGSDESWSTGKTQSYITRHRIVARKYEDLYSQIRVMVENQKVIDLETVKDIQNKKSSIDADVAELPITLIGRYWSKLTIKKEKDISWICKCKEEKD